MSDTNSKVLCYFLAGVLVFLMGKCRNGDFDAAKQRQQECMGQEIACALGDQ